MAIHDLRKAVILARGLGKRMRAESESATLSADQASAADKGVKALIPIGRPFLDYVLSALADSGFGEVCLVTGAEHTALREQYERVSVPVRVRVSFAIQEKPLGTADAVLAAEKFTGGDPFVVLNSDNYYPASALGALRTAPPPAIAGFAVSALLEGNVPADRVTRFGALEVDDQGFLRRIVGDPEKARASTGGELYASMNCWSFTREIFDACRSIGMSARGELELTQAVQRAIDLGSMRLGVVLRRDIVLDMSTRGDIAAVAKLLSHVRVEL
ncbi:MAG TPA: nucleotidyltransferase family protein [Gemmatimonadaceae bacterium]